MIKFVNLLLDYIATEAELRLKMAVSPVAPFLRKLMVGSVLILSSVFSFAIALLALAGCVFALFSNKNEMALDALYTALVFAGVGGVLIAIGLNLVRKPRY